LGRVELERRNTNALSLLDPVLAIGALAVTRSSPLRDDAPGCGGNDRPGKRASREAIDAHVVLVGSHDDGLHFLSQRAGSSATILFRLGNERCRPRSRVVQQSAQRLAAQTMRRWPLSLRAPVRTRALRAIAQTRGILPVGL